MAIDFGVENENYKKALEEIRKIDFPDTYWAEVSNLIEKESIKASQAVKNQRVDDELMRRCFSV